MHVVIEDPAGGKITVTGPAGETPAESQPAVKSTPATEPWEGNGLAATLIKATPELRYSLHVAYPANRPDQCIAADGYRDFAGEAAVEKAAWSYLTKSPRVGLWHQHGTDGAGSVVESYVYRGPSWTIKAVNGTEQVIQPGDWLIGIQWNEDTWPLVVKGRINGVSMQGNASRRKPSPEALARLRS